MKFKDVVYSGIILSILFGVQFVWKWANETELTNQISLITSWISISLAFLAIFYAFYQTWSSQNENQQLTRSIAILSEETQNIRNIKEVINNIENNTKILNNSVTALEAHTAKIVEKFHNTEFTSMDQLRVLFPNASENEIEKAYIELNESTEQFVNDQLNENSSGYSSSGYSKVKAHIDNMEFGTQFTPKEIFKHFNESGIEITTGQVAGALTRLNQANTIENIARGKYTKLKS